MGFGSIPFVVSRRKWTPEKSRLLFSVGIVLRENPVCCFYSEMSFGKIPMVRWQKSCFRENPDLRQRLSSSGKIAFVNFQLSFVLVRNRFSLIFPEKESENLSDVERAFYSVLKSFVVGSLCIFWNVLVVQKKSVRAENVELYVVQKILLPADERVGGYHGILLVFLVAVVHHEFRSHSAAEIKPLELSFRIAERAEVHAHGCNPYSVVFQVERRVRESSFRREKSRELLFIRDSKSPAVVPERA